VLLLRITDSDWFTCSLARSFVRLLTCLLTYSLNHSLNHSLALFVTVPALISALRAAGINCPISIDTRNAIVAREAILHGADVVNDVSGGRHDPEMLRTVAELNVPIVMMHMRGTPQTMTSAAHTTYGEDIIADIAKELNEQLAKADELLPRWLQIVDPGVGFAKGERENVELLKPENMKRLRKLLGDRPLYIGTSRKRFLGAIIDRADALNANNRKVKDSKRG
jgi:dihydropteroate synthase